LISLLGLLLKFNWGIVPLLFFTFTYPGASEPTLRNLTLQVDPGESITLVGLNGAGKTTLLKLLTRLYDVDSGNISIDGIPLQSLKVISRKQYT